MRACHTRDAPGFSPPASMTSGEWTSQNPKTKHDSRDKYTEHITRRKASLIGRRVKWSIEYDSGSTAHVL